VFAAAEDVSPDTSVLDVDPDDVSDDGRIARPVHPRLSSFIGQLLPAAAAAGNNKINPSVDCVSRGRRVEPPRDPIAPAPLAVDPMARPRHRLTDCPRLQQTI